MRSRLRSLCLALLSSAIFVSPASAAVSNRVLIIGVDGAGGSYTQTANMPNLDALAAAGSARYDWLNEGALVPNPPSGYGASGVNWSTIVTGASAAHHGVVDNSFGGSHFDQYPFFFKYLKQKDPTLYTASIVDWAPINTAILDPTTADLAVQGVDDATVASTAVNLLSNGDPDAIFLHFDQVDHAGHGSGWGSTDYYNALQTVDGLIGNVMTALNARPGVANGTESWLVMMSADHGGQGTSHFAGQGLINWEVPFVISGPAVPDGVALKQGTLRDLVPTALWHLGVDPFSTPVDGHVVGIPFGPVNDIVGDLNQDGVVSGNGQGPAATDDVTAFVQGWLTSNHPTVAQSYFKGDLNLDRTTDLKDWIILNKLNPAMAQAALAGLAIPEPAACGLATLALAALAAYRHRNVPSRSRLSVKALALIAVPVVSSIAVPPASAAGLNLVINRDTGAMTITSNPGASQPIIGYQITSSAGTFNRNSWTPIAGRLDDAGDGSIDPDDDWLVLTAANSVVDLSEVSLGAGSIAGGAAINLGAAWAKYYQDSTDVKFLYADGVGVEPLVGAVQFTGNGGASYPRGDVNFDGRLDSEDWSALSTLFGSNLVNKSTAQRYRLGDLNGDGAHTLDDVLQFRLDYDAANGLGAFAAMTTGVPEPTSLLLFACGGLSLLALRRSRLSASCHLLAACALLTAVCISSEAHATTLLSQSFNSIPLGPKVDEALAGANVWSKTPPAGWSIDDSGMPAGGVTEWRGWSFTNPAWWSQAAEDQGRSQFTKGTGVIAVADPDEWDDKTHASGTYNSFLRTPSISLAGVNAGSARLRFDSSWMPEGVQTATVTASYNGGPATEVLRWESEGGNQAFYKSANTNETVTIPLNNPAGAANVTLSFGMTNAGNNWWWAVDNLVVFTPLTLQVDATSGAMKILGDSTIALTGYEIASPSGSLNPAGWRTGNLDAQNVGAPTPASADFNNTGGVNVSDLAVWKTAFGTTAAGDADDDTDSDGADFLRWQRQFGQTSDAGSTWLTLLGTESQLIESFLQGSSTFAADRAIGVGFDAAQGTRDLQFAYTTLAGEKGVGAIQYVNLPPIAAIPEPTSAALLTLASLGLLSMRPRVSTN